MTANYKYYYLLILSCTLILSQCDKEIKREVKEVAKPVKHITLVKPEQIIVRKYPGKVEASEDATLSFQISGKIIEFPVNKGQDIEKGDLIAKLDPIDFQLKFNEAKAIKDEKELTLGRTTILLKKGHASQAQFDKEKAEYDVAKSSLSLAEQNLGYTEIKSPFSGRIADTYIENFQYINSKDPIALLHSKNNIDIAIDVPESMIINIKKTEVLKRAVVFDSAPDKEYEVKYKDVIMQADPQTQTYRAFMTMPTPDKINVLPGMTATVIFNFIKKGSENQPDIFAVPVTSVFTDENKSNYVWKINTESNRLEKLAIETGELKDQDIIITSGLATGDSIVTAGVHLLREDQLVRKLNDNISK